MRIGVFSDSYKPYISGVVRSIETFKEELSKMGHEMVIFAPNYPGAEPEKNVFRFPSVPTPTNNGFYLAVPFTSRLRHFLRENKLDIVHVHSPFILGKLGTRVANELGVPLVFTYHTLYDQYTHYVPFAQELCRVITRKLCVDFCNRCDLVITPTKVVGQYIKDMGVTSPVVNLPTGIRMTEFAHRDKQWLRNTYQIAPDTIILLFVGRLGKEKNIFFLLKCFQLILKRSNHPLKLVLVGEGPEAETLKRYVYDHSLDKAVTFTGKLTRENLIKAYYGSDLFVFSSVTETQGIVIGEAKAAGLPVVAVDSFGVSDMVIHGEDGFLVPHDEQAFVNQVLELIDQPEIRQQLGRRAIANAGDISSQRCAAKLVTFYHQLLQSYTHDKHQESVLL
ncbi:glycosyl transferase group 1 [Desulfotomaculum nigrificans CO-1-SRB]|uniref:Glycosyl transferase group 1 n=1 Tax=Desulfotomaculum nigrificans (strain DSM 14880 / VKM B-2319 / CO-1-SRB) TaxID=868595 RepID=F6B5A1_DESCC|nr:glycosyltransferase family 4 protein [Desulfotomaculum nigrificans]AEF94222.1 glycosyl transferase group 1 [Desulfotomaculum nigrificans CO-1-SRB]